MSLNHTEPTIRNHKETGALSEQSSHISVIRFIRKLAFFLLVFYSISAAIYFFSDENRLTDRNAKIFVNDLQKGDLVIHQPVCEDRREVFQRILQNQNKHFTYLFIGSSRILQFGNRTGFKNALNVGLLGAGLEDVILSDNLCRNYGITADTVVFEFSPWYVDSGTDKRYQQFLFRENAYDALKRIVQFDHGITNFQTCFPRWKRNYQFFHEVKSPEIFRRKFSDGSSARKPISERKRKLEIEHFVTALYQMKAFNKIYNDRLDAYLRVVQNNAQKQPTWVVLSPFHPDLFEQKPNDKRVVNILKSEKLLRTKLPTSVHLLGSFNPAVGNFHDSFFMDGFHITDEAVRTHLRLR
jgi:lysophospholipase L1-like esterase